MIEVQNLTKSYGPVTAIEDVSFTVGRGEIVGFLGPNGAGKTTTMRILTGYMPPTTGTAQVAGFDVLAQSLEARRRIGYLPESVPLYGEFRVRTYLDFVAEAKGVPSRDRRARVDEAMERCAVTDVAGKLVSTLSRGYRQRVGLAQALVNDPEVLILDEPTVGLDPQQIVEIRRLIKGLAGRRTIILSTHILPEVSMTCDRVIIISRGRIVAVDTPGNLTAQVQKSANVLLQVEGPPDRVMAEIRRLEGVQRVAPRGDAVDGRRTYLVESERGRDVRVALAAAMVKNGWGLYELRPADLSLEEIFLHLVTDEAAAHQPGRAAEA
ncbi:MAG TPA: ABC transporter ATP-binding protein [Candidatus Sulfotelmatobacter sp.]|nr:ABC transporter ATP-binding protein [Candidatus Sulfotelmatobacter sp.]